MVHPSRYVWVGRLRRATVDYLLDSLCELVVQYVGNRLFVIGGADNPLFHPNHSESWHDGLRESIAFAPLLNHRSTPFVYIDEDDRLTVIGSRGSANFSQIERYDECCDRWSLVPNCTFGTITDKNWIVHRPPRKPGEQHCLFTISFQHEPKLSRWSLPSYTEDNRVKDDRLKHNRVKDPPLVAHNYVSPVYDIDRDIIWVVCDIDRNIFKHVLMYYCVKTNRWTRHSDPPVICAWTQILVIPNDPFVYLVRESTIHSSYAVTKELSTSKTWTTNDRFNNHSFLYCSFRTTFNDKILIVAGYTSGYTSDPTSRRRIIMYDTTTKQEQLVALLQHQKSLSTLFVL
jgi:hypothetical protein